jgi:hypothetical protein
MAKTKRSTLRRSGIYIVDSFPGGSMGRMAVLKDLFPVSFSEADAADSVWPEVKQSLLDNIQYLYDDALEDARQMLLRGIQTDNSSLNYASPTQ